MHRRKDPLFKQSVTHRVAHLAADGKAEGNLIGRKLWTNRIRMEQFGEELIITPSPCSPFIYRDGFDRTATDLRHSKRPCRSRIFAIYESLIPMGLLIGPPTLTGRHSCL